MTLLALILSILPPGSVEWRQDNTRLGQYEKVNCKGRVRCTQQDLRTVTFDVDAGGLLSNVPQCNLGYAVSCDGCVCSCVYTASTCLSTQAISCDGGVCACVPFVQSLTQCNAGQVATCAAGVCSCVTLVGVLPYANGGFGTTLNCASNERVTCNGSSCSCSAITSYSRATGSVTTFVDDTNFANGGGFTVAATSSASSLTCTTSSAGTTGSDSFVVAIRNVTDTADVCSASFACNLGSATPSNKSCTGTLNTGKVFTFRLNGTPCTTDPSGLQCSLLITTP